MRILRFELKYFPASLLYYYTWQLSIRQTSIFVHAYGRLLHQHRYNYLYHLLNFKHTSYPFIVEVNT